MASVRVAVRLRPMNKRETDMESQIVVQMEDKKTRILNIKNEHSLVESTRGEKWKEFGYDYSYWSMEKNNAKYASQSQIFKDLGMGVVDNAYEGYNACVFAYGQTGSGKTYTMMGNKGDEGLIPRICFELFNRMKDESMTYRAEVSYLEIYNEKVRDLLKSTGSAQHSLRVREHPKHGPYVQDLSKHLVQSYRDIEELMQKGNQSRTTASTNMNDVSSRSHAIFTLVFTQAKFSKESPLETHSKIHLVDLAGSERADATGATGQRLKEGGSINKSLVTLGNVISTLADLSSKPGSKRAHFIPYRDSVLTWLLKDSLGGNSKTMMIATISPAQCNYPETLSTLRYANRAKDIINKPTINEDPNVKLIRELRSEIARLNTLLGGNIDSLTSPKVKEKLHENEAKIKVLTQEWAGRWSAVANILEEEKSLALRKEGLGVVLDSELPHLIGIEDDLLSTGIMLYHLKKGATLIGRTTNDEKNTPDIVLQGPDVDIAHCRIIYHDDDVTLIPGQESPCSVNGHMITEATPLVQGAVILLGQTNMFRFNHPAQAAKMRKEYKVSNLNLSRYSLLSQSMTDLCRSTDNLSITLSEEYETKYADILLELQEKRQEVSLLEEKYCDAERQRVSLLEEKEQELSDTKGRLQQLEQTFHNNHQSINITDENFEAEKVRLGELIRAELSRLLEVETRRVSDAQQQKDQLEEELSSMRLKHTDEKESLAQEMSDLTSQKADLQKRITDIHKRIEHTKREHQQEEQNCQSLEDEKSALKVLQSDFTRYDAVCHQLSDRVTSQLQDKYETLTSQKKTIHDEERQSYEAYVTEKGNINARKEQIKSDLEQERIQLEADEICSVECEDRLSSALASGEMSQEQYEKERDALEVEKARIAKETEKLKVIEQENEVMTLEELRLLDEKRASQIIELNTQKSQLKSAIGECESLLGRVLTDQDDHVLVAKQRASRLLNSIEELENDLEEEKDKVTEKEKQLQLQIEQCEFSQRECSNAWSSVYKKHEVKLGAVESELEQYMLEIHARRQQLEAVDLSRILNETKLRKLIVLLGFHSSAIDMQPNDNSGDRRIIDDNIKTIVKQETLLADTTFDLDRIKTDCEQQREQELDALESEKYELRQLEEEERINSLVDQEMRKRAFDERVEREKQRRIEREREKADRDRELSNIKRAHERELNRMRDKIEESGGMIENAPTRANPYASVMSGDATPTSSRNSRKIKSKSMTNLARTQSISSLHSNLPLKPIKVTVPSFMTRGAGFNTHIDYEVKISVLDDSWVVYRRYSKFRELHLDIKDKFPEIAGLVFPPKRWFGNKTEKVTAERRILLEVYISHVVDILQTNPNYPLHPSHAGIYSKQLICDFHAFFKKGVFEHSQHGTS